MSEGREEGEGERETKEKKRERINTQSCKPMDNITASSTSHWMGPQKYMKNFLKRFLFSSLSWFLPYFFCLALTSSSVRPTSGFVCSSSSGTGPMLLVSS